MFVARNDPGRSWDGVRLGDMPRVRASLPAQFDDKTNNIIRWIDVLWLRENGYVATFEVEHTTTIYSGLLRMSDLLTVQPNISFPLFLVTPEARRSDVIKEVTRPTFAKLKLDEVCRLITFERLRDSLEQVGDHVRFMRSDWLQEISESCVDAPERT